MITFILKPLAEKKILFHPVEQHCPFSDDKLRMLNLAASGDGVRRMAPVDSPSDGFSHESLDVELVGDLFDGVFSRAKTYWVMWLAVNTPNGLPDRNISELMRAWSKAADFIMQGDLTFIASLEQHGWPISVK